MKIRSISRLIACAQLSTLAITIASQQTLAQIAEDPTPATETGAPSDLPQWAKDFNNLPEATRQEFADTMNRASQLFNQKRIFEALQATKQAGEIFDRHPQQINLAGACFVEFRDFDAAKARFNKALEISPDNATVKFNLAEIAFVSKNWNDAKKRFLNLLDSAQLAEGLSKELVIFKLLICELKLNNHEMAKEYAQRYTEEDDTPFFYLSKAIFEFEQDNESEAESWLGAANRVYGRTMSNSLTAFRDAMIESGYLKSFYGGEPEGT